MQISVVAALTAAALGSSALARLNPIDHPVLQARYDPLSTAGTNVTQTPPPTASNSSTRFRTANTESFYVPSMPDVNFQFGEMYAGTIQLDSTTVNANASGTGSNATAQADEMFFIFMPKEGGEPVDELTIWLNGGPGCSSMEGFLQEVGPISWLAGTHSPERNKYAWTNITNMLFVDQPIGTGYSRGTPSATSQPESAAQFLAFLKKFQALFGISNFRIYMTGESYAGRYIPYIADAMLNANDTQHFNISGAIIYDGVIGNHLFTQQQLVAYPYAEENWSHFGFNSSDMATFKELHQQCGYEEYINKYMTFPASGVQPPRFWNRTDPETSKCDLWNSALIGVLNINPCFDPYESNKPCPILWDVLGMSGITNLVPPGTTVYFDRPDVKKALHVPADLTWQQCTKKPVFMAGNGKAGPGQNGDLSEDPIQGALPRVIEATQRVLVANGDFDFVIMTNGTLLSIQNMTWGGALGFQSQPSEPLFIPLRDIQHREAFAASGLGIDQFIMAQGQMGIQHYERGLMWNRVWGAGHMLPAFQPRVAFMQLLWMLGHIDSLGPISAPAGGAGGAAAAGNGTADSNVMSSGNNNGAMSGATAGNSTSSAGSMTGGNAAVGIDSAAGNTTASGNGTVGSGGADGSNAVGGNGDGGSAGSGDLAASGVAGAMVSQAGSSPTASGAGTSGPATVGDAAGGGHAAGGEQGAGGEFVAWASSEFTFGSDGQ
ncbi:pheromone processing carboxypeptidase (Sxa2), putative [Trichosporon asahii var. asahii CBS 8904]|uniref:Carboxypeptidase n=1 Tax=Trichosporon asahii var. asahii (strain CBS 8904) TaxID=1220162 RepID=K1V006_TRIAC|nr:pheromone processing carboxypeptidase (Sxa2), putative [Trichosporon asahii var. asahii CBS 8904]